MMLNQSVSATHPSVILVLGMHRSGTSCLAGSLEEAGLYLGEVNTAAPHNAKGNRESRAIMDLQNDLLRANGGDWDVPPKRVIWSAEHRARRDAIIAGYPLDRIWGFKDPRTLLTLPGWLEALPAVGFVGTFRHPLAVAASLYARNQAPVEKSLTLWSHYNRCLLDYQRTFNFPMVCFDWPPERYRQSLLTLIPALRLSIPPEGLTFFESALRRNAAPPRTGMLDRLLTRFRFVREATPAVGNVMTLPKPVAVLYRQLQEIVA
ncbi:MAG: sulfotransferase family protein [Candidatus Competibacteraceae bacterium]|nr:sulfotransferase family protein [Candidatus Competibacteraceae bacterium]